MKRAAGASRAAAPAGAAITAPAAALALLAFLCCSPAAQAAYEPLGSATTTLTLAKPFARFLHQNRIKLAAVAPAQAKARKLSLPLAAGEWDPTTGKGKVESAGAIVFQSRRRKLPLKELTVKANRQPLTAKVGGGQLKVATSKRIKAKRQGFGSAFQARKLVLSAKVATRLNKKLRPQQPFQPKQLLGTLKTAVQPALMSIRTEGRLTLDPSPDFLAKLQSLFVAVNPIFPAEHPGPFTFPLAPDSTLSPDGTQGTIHTEGEMELLLLGSGQIFWAQQWFDFSQGADLIEANLQPDPPYGGKQGQAPLFSLSLAGAQVTADPAARSVAVAGAPLALSQTAADQLNRLLAAGKSVFSSGDAVGNVSFTALGQ